MASTFGQDNPFRYRGYYYDTETGFYYLNARYYNPELGRFISADPVLDTSNAIGCNMFAYCDNNPVNKADYTGEDAIILIDEDLLPVVGHLGIMFQDENGRWWHFYWGTEFSNFIPAVASIDCAPEMSLKPYIGPLTLDGINGSNVYQDEYENMITLRGDFSEAYTYIRSTASQKYNLYANNCSQKSLNALIACNTSYNEILIDAAQFTVPNNAFTQLKISFRQKSPDLASVINSTNNQIISMY